MCGCLFGAININYNVEVFFFIYIQMTERRIDMFVSSDPANGSQELSSDGSRFKIVLAGAGIKIPKEAKWCDISVEESNIWYSMQNIKTGVNDTMHSSAGTFVIPAGNYDLATLEAVLRRLNATDNEWITLIPDYATGKVIIQLKTAATTIDFSVARTNTFRDLLGFTPQTITATTVNYLAYGTLVAQFSLLTSLLIHSDLSNDGIPVNNVGTNVLGQVAINVKIGSLINSSPRNPARADCTNLIGQTRTSFKIWITDQSDRTVNTGGEYWSARLVIRYVS
jgi:hypothetical protein